MNDETLTPQPATGKRPPGVWILTIYLALFDGIAPLLLLAFVVAAAKATPEDRMPAWAELIVPLLTALGILVSAIAAWRGKNWGRYSLVAFAILHYGLVAVNNFIMLRSDTLPDVPSLHPTLLWGRVVRGPIYIAVVAWYFLASKGARGFYRRADPIR